MCGIAGFAHLDLDDGQAATLLRDMTGIIRHRGPDDEGHWIGDGVGLGMRRLSIIDVSGGSQPITNEDGSVIVVFNGEIYNYQTLRHDLEAAGHYFTTRSDTEAIVHAYEEDGLDFVRRLRGMFAIALWDRQRRRLVLARDRFGKKPLHYTFDGRRLTFGSEVKSLLLAPDMSRQLDPAAISEYFAFGYISAPRTALAGVYKLPPAHILVLQDGQLRLHRYWQLDFTPRCDDDEATAARRVRDLLTEAVRIRLMSEVPLGAFLSGGVDSSAIVALMSEAGSEPVKTFSISFEQDDHNEVEYARLVARRYATDHHELTVHVDLLDILPHLVWDFDEPFADASMVPTYYVSKLAREHVTVALSGDGGDELFGGYTRYLRGQSEARLNRVLGPFRTLAPLVGTLVPDSVRGKRRLETLALSPDARYVETSSIFPSPLRARLLCAEFLAHGASDPRLGQLDRFVELPSPDVFTRMQHVDVEHYLPGDILVKVDRTSMFNSLETRAPLLDHMLAEYVASLRHSVRNPGGHLKHLLKRAVHDLLPDEILTRRKMGFKPPVEYWLRGELSAYVWDMLTSQQARSRGVVNTSFVEHLLTEHQRGVRDHHLRIWSWLCFELWCRLYLDGTDRAALAAPSGREKLSLRSV